MSIINCRAKRATEMNVIRNGIKESIGNLAPFQNNKVDKNTTGSISNCRPKNIVKKGGKE